MDLPASVKIGFRTYRIEDWAPRSAEASNRYGECSHIECLIRVATSYGEGQAAETLLHEIMHGVWAAYLMDDKDEQERTVGAMSRGLTAVWIDNPGLLAWFDAATRS